MSLILSLLRVTHKNQSLPEKMSFLLVGDFRIKPKTDELTCFVEQFYKTIKS